MVTVASERALLPEPECENCGSNEGIALVTYDAMVDGPGYEIGEYRCAECRGASDGS